MILLGGFEPSTRASPQQLSAHVGPCTWLSRHRGKECPMKRVCVFWEILQSCWLWREVMSAGASASGPNTVNVTLLSVTRICCCLCKVLESMNRDKTRNKTFQQVHAISGLSLSHFPATMALAFSSSSSNMILYKACVPGKDRHCYHYGPCPREDCLHIFCT